jgi:uncharacterized protein (TIGR00730 family)
MARLIKSVCVFCGSNFGTSDVYRNAAAAMGRELARRRITVTFGGTHKGLMGVLGDAVLDAGGTVHGVITQRLFDRGQLHPRLTAHDVVVDMRSRKGRMLELADACIALPGGIGTVEEFMEAWTLNQLGDIDKPVGLLDVDRFFQPFMAFIDSMIARQFLPSAHRATLVVAEQPGVLLDMLGAQEAVTTSKWMS